MSWNPDRVLSFRKTEAARGASLESTPSKTGARIVPSSPRVRVGIWDLDACAGGLPLLLDRMEDVQDQFSWFAVEAPFQTGLTATGDHVARSWRRRTGVEMKPAIARANVLASPLFAAAEPVLQKLPIDWLVLIVRSMIADDADPKDAWVNLFSTHKDTTIIVSTCDLRRFAAETDRPFEAAVVLNVLSELLAAMVPDVVMQDKTTGSIFDYCERRSDIAASLRHPHIDPQNRQAIPAPLLAAVDRMIDAIKSYKGSESKREIRRTRRYFETAGAKMKLSAPVKVAPPVAATKKFKASVKIGTAAAAKPKAKAVRRSLDMAPPDFAFEALVKHLGTLAPERESGKPAPARSKRTAGSRTTPTTSAKKPRKET